MRIVVNGRDREVDEGATIGALVDAEVPDRRGVAVALDGEVVPRTAWDATSLNAGVRVELVGAAQGG